MMVETVEPVLPAVAAFLSKYTLDHAIRHLLDVRGNILARAENNDYDYNALQRSKKPAGGVVAGLHMVETRGWVENMASSEAGASGASCDVFRATSNTDVTSESVNRSRIVNEDDFSQETSSIGFDRVASDAGIKNTSDTVVVDDEETELKCLKAVHEAFVSLEARRSHIPVEDIETLIEDEIEDLFLSAGDQGNECNPFPSLGLSDLVNCGTCHLNQFHSYVLTRRYGWSQTPAGTVSRKESFNDLLDNFLLWFQYQNISSEQLQSYKQCIINSPNRPVVRQQTTMRLINWIRKRLSVASDETYHQIKELFLLALADVWSAVRYSCANRIGQIVDLFTEHQVKDWYLTLCQIALTKDISWRNIEGGIMGIHTLMRRFHRINSIKDNSYYIKYGNYRLKGIPEYIRGRVTFDLCLPLARSLDDPGRPRAACMNNGPYSLGNNSSCANDTSSTPTAVVPTISATSATSLVTTTSTTSTTATTTKATTPANITTTPTDSTTTTTPTKIITAPSPLIATTKEFRPVSHTQKPQRSSTPSPTSSSPPTSPAAVGEETGSSIRDVTFNLLGHEQLTIREFALKTFASYLTKCDFKEAIHSFKDLIHLLNESNQTCIRDPCLADGLLGLTVELAKQIPSGYLLPEWPSYFTTFVLYLGHNASIVRQITSSVFKYLVAKDSSNPMILKLVMQGLSDNWKRNTHKNNWQLNEGILFSYELILQFLIKNYSIYTFGTIFPDRIPNININDSNNLGSSLPRVSLSVTPDPHKKSFYKNQGDNCLNSSFGSYERHADSRIAAALRLGNNRNVTINETPSLHHFVRQYQSPPPPLPTSPSTLTSAALSGGAGGVPYIARTTSPTTPNATYNSENPLCAVTPTSLTPAHAQPPPPSTPTTTITAAATSSVYTCTRSLSLLRQTKLHDSSYSHDKEKIVAANEDGDTWTRHMDMKPLSSTLTEVFQQTIESLNDEIWELQRMAKQLLPCLVELIHWFDANLFPAIISTYFLETNNSIHEYGCMLAIEHALRNCIKLSKLSESTHHISQDKELYIETTAAIKEKFTENLAKWSAKIYDLMVNDRTAAISPPLPSPKDGAALVTSSRDHHLQDNNNSSWNTRRLHVTSSVLLQIYNSNLLGDSVDNSTMDMYIYGIIKSLNKIMDFESYTHENEMNRCKLPDCCHYAQYVYKYVSGIGSSSLTYFFDQCTVLRHEGHSTTLETCIANFSRLLWQCREDAELCKIVLECMKCLSLRPINNENVEVLFTNCQPTLKNIRNCLVKKGYSSTTLSHIVEIYYNLLTRFFPSSSSSYSSAPCSSPSTAFFFLSSHIEQSRDNLSSTITSMEICLRNLYPDKPTPTSPTRPPSCNAVVYTRDLSVNSNDLYKSPLTCDDEDTEGSESEETDIIDSEQFNDITSDVCYDSDWDSVCDDNSDKENVLLLDGICKLLSKIRPTIVELGYTGHREDLVNLDKLNDLAESYI